MPSLASASHNRNRNRNRNASGNITELPMAMFALFLLFAFPLINLVSLVLAYAAVWYISFQSALVASTQPDFDSSLSALVKKTADLNGGGLTSMLKMTAVNGYKACGTDLYVDAVDFMDSTKDQKFGPNKAVPPPIDLTNHFYEFTADSTYSIEPFVDLSAVPLLASVPGIGSTATLSAKVKRCAEFPQGLVRGPGALNSGPSSAMRPTLPPSFASPALAGRNSIEPWNRPKIYEEIEAAGQNVVGHTVVIVDAQNATWTDTGLTVNPGQTVWLDFRADGQWGGSSNMADLTADGYFANTNYTTSIYQAYTYNLVGAVSPKEPLIKINNPRGGSLSAPGLTVPYDFTVGSELYKYRPTKTGALMLGFNDIDASFRAEMDFNSGFHPPGKTFDDLVKDYYKKHQGTMTVRIIVTQ
jgi:hypothetical protein